MEGLFFYLLAGLTLLGGVLVVANPFSRNPVTSAMFLVATIVAMAGLFVLLHAFFLAAVQVLVYAGAVLVLFLFVIMLLNLQEESRRRLRKMVLGLAGVAVASLILILGRAIWESRLGQSLPEPVLQGEPFPLGDVLFREFLLPFEVVSVLLVVAMVGVVLLSKKELR